MALLIDEKSYFDFAQAATRQNWQIVDLISLRRCKALSTLMQYDNHSRSRARHSAGPARRNSTSDIRLSSRRIVHC